jgi:hypothetical protein
MTVAEVARKSPFTPFAKGEIFLFTAFKKPLFGKACPEPRPREGKGRFLARAMQK